MTYCLIQLGRASASEVSSRWKTCCMDDIFLITASVNLSILCSISAKPCQENIWSINENFCIGINHSPLIYSIIFLVTVGLTQFCRHWKSVRFVVDSRRQTNNKAGCVGHILSAQWVCNFLAFSRLSCPLMCVWNVCNSVCIVFRMHIQCVVYYCYTV